MAVYSSTRATRQPWVADRDSLVRDTGHTVNWALVPADGTYGVTGKRVIPSGTRMGTLLSGDGQIVPRVAVTNPANCILETDANEDSKTDSRSGYGVLRGGSLYENLLPGAVGDPRRILAAERQELADADETTGFAWQQYVDSSAG